MRVKEESEKASLELSILKTKIMAFGPITSWQTEGEKVETVTDFLFLGSKITANVDCSREIRRCLLLGRKAMTNLVCGCLVAQLCQTLCSPMDGSPLDSCPWRFSGQEYWGGLPCPPPGNLPNSGIEPRPPELQVNSLLSEPPGKLKNTGMGSLSLLQGIFLTQELNWGLLHCRRILYQLSYQGSS